MRGVIFNNFSLSIGLRHFIHLLQKLQIYIITIVTMPRSKTLRKELKDQVRNDVRQEQERHKQIFECVSENIETWKNNVDGIPLSDITRNLAGVGLADKLERTREAAEQKVKDIAYGRLPPNISYKESNQKPLKGEKALMLDVELGTGLDYNPVFSHLSDWLRTIFRGDYERFLGIIHELSEDEVKGLLCKRETLFNVPAVFHAVMGAALFFSQTPVGQDHKNILRQQIDAKSGHTEILIKLISLGVDVNARDIGGRTPLHYCCLGSGHNNVTQEMAEILIKAGADINAKDRTGETALYSSAVHSQIDFVRFFLSNGADPNIRTNDGRNVYTKFISAPCIKDVLGEFDKNRALEERNTSRAAVGGSFRTCGACGAGVGEKIMRRCTGCYLAWYCGEKCIRDHWHVHKSECKKIQLQYKTFYVTDKQEKGKNYQTGQVFSRLAGDRPKKSHCVVKVMIDSDGLKVYSEDHLLYGHIIKTFTPSEAHEMKQKIKKEGNKRIKAFFYAIIPKDGTKKKDGVQVVEIKINTKKIQPIEGW